MTKLRSLRRRTKWHGEVVAAYLVALVLFLIGSVAIHGFATVTNLRTILTLASFIGIAAAGQTAVVITGGVDLSIPWIMSSSALLLGVLAHSNGSLAWAIPVVLACGAGIGAVNGIGVAYFGISPIIMTLAMNTILSGIATEISTSLSVNVPSQISNLSSEHVGPFTVDVFIWIVVGIVVLVYLGLTVPGRSIYSVGANMKVSRFSGIRVQTSLVSAYVVSGITAVCAGVIVAGYGGQAFGGLGDPYLFSSVAAVAIGGVSIYGGSGSYAGAAAGALIVACLGAILAAMSLGAGTLDVVYGVVIIAAMLLIRIPSIKVRLRSKRQSASVKVTEVGDADADADAEVEVSTATNGGTQ